MKPYWIIENITREPSYLELAQAVEASGFPLLKLNGDYKHSLLDQFRSGPQCVVLSASIEMAKLIKENLPNTCYPVTYSNFDNYLCTKWYPKLGKFLFNQEYAMISLAELNLQKWFYYEVFGSEAMIFVRPDSGDKPFKAGLVDLQDFDSFYEEFKELDNELVIVSNPKNILGEWRFVVSRKKEIIAVSSYRYQGLTTRVPSAPKGATDLCRQILEEGYFPDSVFCIDIAQRKDGGFGLMELTSFSSAGLYAANKAAIVEKVSEIALEDFKEIFP